jgi:hypothetical protein
MVKLKSYNRPEKEAELVFVYRDDEVIIALPTGKEIASLHIQTMDKDIKVDDKWTTGPTNNFWVEFRAKKSSVENNMADVIVE